MVELFASVAELARTADAQLVLDHLGDAERPGLRHALGPLIVEHVRPDPLGVGLLAEEGLVRLVLMHLLEEHPDEHAFELGRGVVQLLQRGLLLGRERGGGAGAGWIDRHQMMSMSACREPDSRSACTIEIRSRGETPIVLSARTTWLSVGAPVM